MTLHTDETHLMSASAPQVGRHRAYRGVEPFVFVSYSHDDATAVDLEIAALADDGIRVSYDEGINPGHLWHDELAQAIETCALFLMFVTPRSIASRHCQRELSFAIEKDRPVLPVYLEDTEVRSGIRLQIGDRQAIMRSHFNAAEYRARLITALRGYVGSAHETRPSMRATESVAAGNRRGLSKSVVLAFGVIASVLLIAAYAGYLYREGARTREALETRTLAEVLHLVEQDQYGAAFTLARPLIESAGANVGLRALWRQIVVPMTPQVSQTEATVFFKPYNDVDGAWVLAGTTPFTKPVDAPRGVLRLKIEKPGFRTGYFAAANPGPSLQSGEELSQADELSRESPPVSSTPMKLVPVGALADDMVLVAHSNTPVFLTGWSQGLVGGYQYDIPDFAIGRAEITNREFKVFVDAGGYGNASYWQGLKFVEDGRELAASDARARFVDRTGRPGPADWELSAFPTGAADLPVGGISWYEAVAYARFRGLSLPTVHHWLRAAFGPYEGLYPTAPDVANASRFSAAGPAAANAEAGIGPWGTLNAAGNVREWVWNFAGNQALALGGAWSDYADTFSEAYATEPMNRSPEYGLRLMQVMADTPVASELLEPIQLLTGSDASKREPVSDDAFAAMRFQFTATHRAPKTVVVEQVEQTDTYVADEVVLGFADASTFSLYIVRPRGHGGALQPIIYGPNSDAVKSAQPNRRALAQLFFSEFIVSGGRALVIPIWAGSYERFVPLPRDAAAQWDRDRRGPLDRQSDLATTLDYLATRDDIDVGAAGYLGLCQGSAFIAPPLLAVEGRLKAAALISGGIWVTPSHPMSEAINYAPHITVPVLMINGRYDTVFPYELQRRFFDLLATPATAKRHVVYDEAHLVVLGNQGKREVSDWFDRYLGPVR